MALAEDQGGTSIQGFAPEPTLSQEYTIGTTAALVVTYWTAIRWNSKDGATPVARILNSNSTGLTALGAVDVLPVGEVVTTISFTGTAGTVVEIEGMA